MPAMATLIFATTASLFVALTTVTRTASTYLGSTRRLIAQWIQRAINLSYSSRYYGSSSGHDFRDAVRALASGLSLALLGQFAETQPEECRHRRFFGRHAADVLTEVI